MSQGSALRKGDSVRLLRKPDGYTASQYALTVNNIYIVRDFAGSCVVTTSDKPGEEAMYWQGRVEKVTPSP